MTCKKERKEGKQTKKSKDKEESKKPGKRGGKRPDANLAVFLTGERIERQRERERERLKDTAAVERGREARMHCDRKTKRGRGNEVFGQSTPSHQMSRGVRWISTLLEAALCGGNER